MSTEDHGPSGRRTSGRLYGKHCSGSTCSHKNSVDQVPPPCRGIVSFRYGPRAYSCCSPTPKAYRGQNAADSVVLGWPRCESSVHTASSFPHDSLSLSGWLERVHETHMGRG
uniref:(northern house mosquito) hypothetical protein n=1 Tax=Culex pipiens TaxID=7175 RepID=A0A8D8IP79_CULPI